VADANQVVIIQQPRNHSPAGIDGNTSKEKPAAATFSSPAEQNGLTNLSDHDRTMRTTRNR